MDSNGFKALAFLHFYLCGVVAAYVAYHEGQEAFETIIASSVLLTTGVLTALWIHEWRGDEGNGAHAFGPGAARAAVIVGWVSVAVLLVTQSYSIVYAAYMALLALLLYRARSMGVEESGYRERVQA